VTGFDVDLAALDRAAYGVARIMRDMESCAVDDIDGGAAQYGHDGLHSAFEHFCDRWQYGVEVLVEDGATIVRALNASMDVYLETDRTAEHSMRSAGSGADPAREPADG
jgi:hypothetical protein